MGRTLRAVALRSSATVNYASLARHLGIDDKSVKSHIDVLEQLMLVRRHGPWFGNLGKRQTRAPKLFITDSGLWASLVGADSDRFVTDPILAGQAMETFVAMELVRQLEWSRTRATIHHYRDRDQREVDIVLEGRDGRLDGQGSRLSHAPPPARALSRSLRAGNHPLHRPGDHRVW